MNYTINRGDVIWFTPESMEKIFKIFGTNNTKLKNEYSEIWNMSLNLIKNRKDYTDKIEKLSATESLGHLFTKASFSIGVEALNIPRSYIPEQYLVTENKDGTLKLDILNKDLFFIKDENREKWELFKKVIPILEFNLIDYPCYKMGHSF